MKNLFSAALVAILFCTSCAASPSSSVSENRTLSGKSFSALSVNSVIEVTYVQPANVDMKVSGPSDQLKDFSATVKDGVLRLSYDGHKASAKTIKVVLNAPTINSFEAGGASTIIVKQPVNATDVTVTAHGASDVKIPGCSATQVTVTASGSSDVNLGSVLCDNFKTVASGSSDVDASALTCSTAAIEASGTSDVEIKGVQVLTIDVNASGSSDVELAGKAGRANFNASGISTISSSRLEVNGGNASASGNSNIRCNIADLHQTSDRLSTITNN